MHIENSNFHIHLGGGPIAAAALAALLGRESADIEPTSSPRTSPAIGDRWPGLDGWYAGLARAEGDRSEGPLVLLDAEPPKGMGHDEMKAWAESLGDGARLATRSEGALLYAHLRDKLKTDRWYWLLDASQSSSSYAWGQSFDYGDQLTINKSYEGWGCAVRRF